MAQYARPIDTVMQLLTRLPTIGPKTAERLTFHLLDWSSEDVERLSRSLNELKQRIRRCEQCYNYSENALCPICQDSSRDPSVICVVADTRDLMAMENAGGFRGLYHVLLGLLSPIDGIGPESLTIDALLARVADGGVNEVVLATNHTVEGDVTAAHIAERLRTTGVQATRIALGLPVGGDLDYADQVTIMRALEGRTPIHVES